MNPTAMGIATQNGHASIVQMLEHHQPRAAAKDLVACQQRLAFASCFAHSAHLALPDGVSARIAELDLPIVYAQEADGGMQYYCAARQIRAAAPAPHRHGVCLPSSPRLTPPLSPPALPHVLALQCHFTIQKASNCCVDTKFVIRTGWTMAGCACHGPDNRVAPGHAGQGWDSDAAEEQTQAARLRRRGGGRGGGEGKQVGLMTGYDAHRCYE